MILPRLYAISGFLAAAGLAATFLIIAYGWVAGSLWRFLDPVFAVFLILVLLWLLALPFLLTLTWRQRLLTAGLFIIVFVVPAFIFQTGFYRLFVPSALLLKAFSSQPIYLILESIVLLVLLTLTARILQSGDTSALWRRRLHFVFSLTVVLFSLPILVNLQTADALQRTVYGFLVSVRGEYKPENPEVVIFQIQNEQMSNNHFLQLVQLLEQGKPAVIGVITSGTPIPALDTLPSFVKTPIVTEYGSDHLILTTQSGVISADRQTGRFAAIMGMPMYYRPLSRSGIDYSVKLAHRYFRSKGLPADLSRSSSSVTLGRTSIPLVDDQKALINHYWKYASSSGSWRYIRPVFRELSYDDFDNGLFGSDNSIWDSENFPRYYHVNYKKQRIESPTGKEIIHREGEVTWKTNELEPTTIDLKGKVLVIEITGFNPPRLPLPGMQGDAHVIASITQNIIDGDFVGEVKVWTIPWLSAILMILTWLAYRRWGAFWACGITLIAGLVIGALIVVGFTQWAFFFNPIPLACALAGSLLVFFPVGVVSERQVMMKERTRLNAELQAARDMQMGLMPKEDPVVPGFDITGICVPAHEVGGDFFDYVWLDDKKTKLGIAVADVSGKAMRAAITAVMTSGMIYQEISNGESPKKVLRKINKPLFMKIDDRMFTALSFAVLDVKRKELRFSNAGQMYPVLKRNGRVIMLEVKGARLPLGVKEDVAYEEMAVNLKKGDIVVFYTDGIPEAKNEKDEFYGFDRFKALASTLSGASANEARDRILEDVKSFTGKSQQYDDMTVVVVKVS